MFCAFQIDSPDVESGKLVMDSTAQILACHLYQLIVFTISFFFYATLFCSLNMFIDNIKTNKRIVEECDIGNDFIIKTSEDNEVKQGNIDCHCRKHVVTR